MINALLSLPTLVGFPAFVALVTAVGLTAYYVTFRLYDKRRNEDTIREIRDATGNLFRVVGWLFTLLLSLTFTDVLGELAVTETAVESEAVAIEDVHHKLQRFSREETREIRNLLIEYTQAAITDDWPALANNRLSKRVDALQRQLEDAALDLKATNATQEALLSRVIADIDMMSDYRLARQQQAREQPSLVLVVVFFGYLVTMVLFGIYVPHRAFVVLLSFYTLFVGVVIYLILAMSEPFHGAAAVDTAPLEYVLEIMRAGNGANS